MMVVWLCEECGGCECVCDGGGDGDGEERRDGNWEGEEWGYILE